MDYHPIGKLQSVEQFRKYLTSLNLSLEFDEIVAGGSESPLGKPYRLSDGMIIGNRFCVQPMEGWDGTVDGKPSEYTFRRWCNFGRSGAKLIWGGEAVAITHESRANPNQLMINEQNLFDLEKLRKELVHTHQSLFQKTDDLLIGLQLTHSGRFSRPNQKTKPEPIIVYHHPYLDKKVGIPSDYPVISDSQIEKTIEQFVHSARLAKKAGFDFVDVKACHGYLGHEFLSAYTRPGKYGGSFENRTNFIKSIINGIKTEVPGLRIGVRVSIFDFPMFNPNPESRVGEPVTAPDYPRAFGNSPDNPLEICLDEPIQFLNMLSMLGVEMVNLTAGSPYYNPHIQRPAFFPPSDGYKLPEDPLVGVARHISVCSKLKERFPKILFVGSAYTYLQEWLENVGQYYVRTNQVDFIGLGRMILSYPQFPADILLGNPLNKRAICRTFSDCTTAPRHGLISGCYPLDDFYKQLGDYKKLQEVKGKKK